jgi:hypothetical protein
MSDTISSVLQAKQHVGEVIPSKTAQRRGRVEEDVQLSAAEVAKRNDDKTYWEWVEIPDTDLFGELHTGVSINFQHFDPGKYFVSPEMASEVKKLLANRMRGDMRVLQPRQDVIMARIMAKSQLGAPINPGLEGLNDK